MFKTLVPQKANDLFAAKDRATAPEEFVRLFLLKEESAQRHETKTDNILDGKEDGEGARRRRRTQSSLRKTSSTKLSRNVSRT